MMTEQEFRTAVENFDMAYSFSDDHRKWTAGVAAEKRILTMAAQLPREVAVRIWNETVDKRWLPHARDTFYWRT
jgi:hypothetical protein